MNKIIKIGFILLTCLSFSALADDESCESLYQKDDDELTVKVCTVEAQNGNAIAQFNLAYMYDEGLGVAQDYAKAKQWYELSAAQNDPEAQNNLGYLYYFGLGVPQNYAKAKEWFELSAAQNNSFSQYNLASLYEYGLGMPINYEKARQWYKKSCDNGDNDGCRGYQDLIEK